MTIWSGEIKELDKLYESCKGHLPDVMKELEQLVSTDDPNVVMLYSRRCLEVIVTDLCESELKRPRKTEPLKGIIDKLNSEDKVPSHIINSMLSLNSMANFGAHPKDFDPEQVKPVLNNLSIIIRWYLKYKNFKIVSKTEHVGRAVEINIQSNSTREILSNYKRVILLSSGIIIGLVIVGILLFFIVGKNRNLNHYKGLEKTIAVLPFRNLSNDSSQLYFCDGFMEEVLNNLQRIGEFKVRSRTSTDQYRNSKKTIKTIAEELNVNYLIEGSVGKQDDSLKIWVNLINTKTDQPVWSKKYTKVFNQIFSIQNEIPKTIANELRTILSPEEIKQINKKPTENLEAYNYYLLGNEYYQRGYAKQDFEIANKMYEKAIELDRKFALAYVRRSLCHLSLYWFYYDQNTDRLSKCKEGIDEALKIDQNLPEAHLALGTYYYWGFLNYKEALDELKIAEKYLKNNSELTYIRACIYRRAGEWQLAKENYLTAYQLDPGSIKTLQDLAGTYYLLGEYEEAEKYFEKTILLNPAFIEAIYYKSLMYMKWNGNTLLAKKTIWEAFQFQVCSSNPVLIELSVLLDIYDGNYKNALATLSQNNFDVIENQRYYFNLKALLYAKVYQLMDQPEKASEYYNSALTSLESRISKDSLDSRLYSTAGIAYAGLGMKKKAVEAGKKGLELMPINKEAYRGVCRTEDLARIYVMVGDYDAAIGQIKILLSLPGPMSVKLLQLDLDWKPLWDLNEFKELVKIYTQK